MRRAPLILFAVPFALSSLRAEPDPDRADVGRAIERGARFLLESQNPDGSWGSARQTKGLNIYAPVPGAHHAFRTAVTSLALSALTETGGDGEAVVGALERGERWLVERLPELRRATPDAIYNVWGHAYAIQALADRIEATEDEERRSEMKDLIRGQIELLERYETVAGGWGYYDFEVGSKKPAGSPTCFTTATVLIAFDDARRIGIEPPRKLVERALASIRRQQKPDFSYLYGEYLWWQPMRGINRVAGSLGRSQACNLALRRWGDREITAEVLRHWLEKILDRNLWLDMGRKRPIPHEAWFQVAGYFFYYGHYYAGLCLAELPEEDPETRSLARRLAGVLVELQEKDGSWWDFPFYSYHQPYGTAFALMALGRCRGAMGEGA